MRRENGKWIFFTIVAVLLANAVFRFVAWLVVLSQMHPDMQAPLFLYLQRTGPDSYFFEIMLLVALFAVEKKSPNIPAGGSFRKSSFERT